VSYFRETGHVRTGLPDGGGTGGGGSGGGGGGGASIKPPDIHSHPFIALLIVGDRGRQTHRISTHARTHAHTVRHPPRWSSTQQRWCWRSP